MPEGLTPNAAELRLLDKITNQGGAGLKVALYTTALVLGPDTVFADIVEPADSWYERKDANFTPASVDDDGRAWTISEGIVWEKDGTDPAITLYGYAVIEDIGGGEWDIVRIEEFEEPVEFTSGDSSLAILVNLKLSDIADVLPA